MFEIAVLLSLVNFAVLRFLEPVKEKVGKEAGAGETTGDG